MKLRTAVAALVAAVAAAAAVLVTAQPALADSYTINGTCGSGSPRPSSFGLCLYWGQNYDGSRSNVNAVQISDFPVGGSTNLVYVSSGSGQGQYLGNNNGSVRNYTFNCHVIIYYDPGFGGWSLELSQWGGDGIYPWELKGSQQLILLNNIRSMKTVRCIGF